MRPVALGLPDFGIGVSAMSPRARDLRATHQRRSKTERRYLDNFAMLAAFIAFAQYGLGAIATRWSSERPFL